MYKVILNSISIACILICCMYLVVILDNKEIKPLKGLRKAWFGDYSVLHHVWENIKYLPILLMIPVMLMIALTLITQMGIGNLRVRLDIQFLTSCLFWILAAITCILWGTKHKNKK